MKQKSLVLGILFLVGAPLFAAGRVMPNLEIQVEPGIKVPVEVRLAQRRGFTLNYKTIAVGQSDQRGRVFFPSQKLKNARWLVLTFIWHPPGLAERVLVYEIGTRKGEKSPRGRLLRTDKQKSGYVLGTGLPQGDCNNLFSIEEQGNSADKTWRIRLKPARSYSDCQELGDPIDRYADIGKRNINKGNLNLYKFDDDVRMGKQFFQQLEATPENPPLRDPYINEYIETMVQRIGKNSDMPDLDYTVTVIDADVLNAFAVPGGYVFVYRGLLEDVETEAELAGVLAHEIAHVTGRHGTEGVTSAIGKVTLGMIAGQVVAEQAKDQEALVQQVVAGLIGAGTQFWIVGGTRTREAEADKLGAQYAARAGYDPRGIATLFDRWSKKKGKPQTRIDTLFSDHPSDGERVAAVTRDVAYFIPVTDDMVTSSKAFHAMKRRLKQLPPSQAQGQAAGNALFSTFQRVNQEIIGREIGLHFEQQQ
ncbi:M48 family metallopeptidase [Acanthopleuribacter pedis]|uniref:M48 family metalloprotease n=1 Tax=Acanthopleuribacter pedis TaxID=442870 RepID=A0A8J7QGG2_9BACT|nr:M48 family metallopeptidase [Acanthopleuribacter pedis]MBO1321825.1 M48 family metalloprotease [Acanthopleuribacter pedis]